MSEGWPRPVVFVHIGEPKSGTTFLQEILWGNRDALAEQGVLLPGTNVWHHFRAMQDLREMPHVEGDPAGPWKGEWDVLAAQARQANRAAVISHELLVAATADQAARAVRSLAPAQVHIVLTLRDVAGLLPAEWQETIKHRNVLNWDEWLAAIIDSPGRRRWFWQAHNTPRILRRWGAEVPPGRVHIITTPRRDAPPTLLWERFASVLGVDPASVDTSAARPNASLGRAEAELLRRLNGQLSAEIPDWFYSAEVKDRLAHQALAERPRSPRPQLPPDRQAWAEAHAEKLIRTLGRGGYDVVGDLDELRPMAPSTTTVDPPTVSDHDVLDAALAAMSWLVRDDWRIAQTRGLRPPAVVGGHVVTSRMGRLVRDLTARYPVIARLRVRAGRTVERMRAWQRGT